MDGSSFPFICFRKMCPKAQGLERLQMGGKEEQDRNKREERRKRRFRNQIIAYIVSAAAVMALAAGIVFGAGYLMEESRKAKQKELDRQPLDGQISLLDAIEKTESEE